MMRNSKALPFARAAIAPFMAGLIACGAGAGAHAQDASQSDLEYALQLLERAGLPADSAAIVRVLRDELETVVWIEPRVRGLPVFFRQVGYAFDADGNRALDPTGEPLVLGDPLPEEPSQLDDRPEVTADSAIAVFRAQAWPDPVDAAEPLEAVLGFAEGPASHPYVLAWRVRPRGQDAPVAMVDANAGDAVSHDSGIRCVRAPCP